MLHYLVLYATVFILLALAVYFALFIRRERHKIMDRRDREHPMSRVSPTSLSSFYLSQKDPVHFPNPKPDKSISSKSIFEFSEWEKEYLEGKYLEENSK